MDKLFAEKIRKPISGYVILVLEVVVVAMAFMFMVGGVTAPGVVLWLLFIFLVRGLLVIPPNTAKVLLLFGKYEGTVRESGFFWMNPFYQRLTVSMRARNFESEQLKVNDKMGNPVLISMVLVWKVRDTYRASFEVDQYENFIKVQTDS
ncbi:MAG TPA: SPFH domain-containing protein, partial [Puia sp.]|nr:SPFH domain-containing protein [Puia sp.]